MLSLQKQSLLSLLKQEPHPITVKDLLNKLEAGYSERSVRRWLAEMIEEGLVVKIGQKRSTKYSISTHPNQPSISTQEPFGTESKKIISLVRRPLYERTPIAYVDEWIESYKPNISFYIPLETRKRLHLAGRRSKKEDPAGTYAHQIFNRLLIDLSYNSSRLEGNTYSLLDTQKLLLEGTSAEGKLDEEAVMILNHKEAIRYLVDNASKIEISTHVICTLHFLLSDGLVEAHYVGRVRDHAVRIGGSTYAPFEDPKQLERRLDAITQKAQMIDDPYEQSLFLLVHISYLQAFCVVNKRTARLSANISLIKNNLVPLSFNDVDKEDYISAIIAIYEFQDIRPILDLYMFSYMRTCAMYDVAVKAIGFDEIRVRYRQQRREVIRNIILKKLSERDLDSYIFSETKHLVPEKDLKDFYEDILEDLKEINDIRIAGLGISPEQLKEWLAIQKK